MSRDPAAEKKGSTTLSKKMQVVNSLQVLNNQHVNLQIHNKLIKSI